MAMFARRLDHYLPHHSWFVDPKGPKERTSSLCPSFTAFSKATTKARTAGLSMLRDPPDISPSSARFNSSWSDLVIFGIVPLRFAFAFLIERTTQFAKPSRFYHQQWLRHGLS